jgi:hypothetical protein
MRADPEEHIGLDTQRNGFPYVKVLLIAGIFAGLSVYWLSGKEQQPETTVVQLPATPTTAKQPELPQTPDIPQRPKPAVASAPETGSVMPEAETYSDQPATLPPSKPLTPEEGDALLRQQFRAIGAGTALTKLLNDQQPLELSAALIDGLGRGIILRKFLPSTSPPDEAFTVVQEDDAIYMDSVSYLRYDRYADAITALDVQALIDSFHTMRPLYEQAYGYMGLDTNDFDNAVVRTLDLIIATPEIGEPIALKPKAVIYTFADPSLESLAAVQKQMLRMGPDNIRRIKLQAQLLRDGLLTQ